MTAVLPGDGAAADRGLLPAARRVVRDIRDALDARITTLLDTLPSGS
ncbi:hypothetical protein ACHGLA_20085 [Streptomyces sp. YH02]